MKLKEDEIAGFNVKIEVDTNGRFVVKTISGDTVGSGYDLETAVKAARAALAKSKVKASVAFRTTAGEYGIATGIHAGTKNVLARIGDQSIQMGYGDLNKVLDANTPDDDLKRLAEIARQMRDLEAERHTIENTYRIDLRVAVEKAIQEAQL